MPRNCLQVRGQLEDLHEVPFQKERLSRPFHLNQQPEAVGMCCNISSFPTQNVLRRIHLFPCVLYLTGCPSSSARIGSSLERRVETPAPITSYNPCKMDNSRRRLSNWNWWQSVNCRLLCNGSALVMRCDQNQRELLPRVAKLIVSKDKAGLELPWRTFHFSSQSWISLNQRSNPSSPRLPFAQSAVRPSFIPVESCACLASLAEAQSCPVFSPL